MNISEFQKKASLTDVSSKAPWVGLSQNLFGLIEKAGDICGSMKKQLRDSGSYSEKKFRYDMERSIGEALWYLAAVATHFNLDLEKIAENNLSENKSRWGHRDEQGQLFKGRVFDGVADNEQFPEVLTVEFTSTTGPNQISWLSVTGVQVEGKSFGDPIDDNTPESDGYRYHDVLHFAFATFLKWSPVVRGLLRKKRKADPKRDKYEDGARARNTEEAVSNLIHQHARENNFFEGAMHLDTNLLTEIQSQVVRLEVKDRSGREWEECILAAYDVLRELRKNDGGFVDVYFEEPKLVFRTK